MSVRINLEIGHEASIRTKRTPEGFSHDWEVYLKGLDGAHIHYYVEKVVFFLHETFPKPKRVLKEPPYSVKESGYAGFTLPIEIHLRNKDEPKKISFSYDLNLQQTGPTLVKQQKEKYIFNSVGEEFKSKLLKGGGFIVNSSNYQETSRENRLSEEKSQQLVSKPRLGGSEFAFKKHKPKAEESRTSNSFQDLFGTPITKTSKVPVDAKVVSKDKNSNINKPSFAEKDKSKNKHSPHKDREKNREKDFEKKNKDEKKREEKKEHSKDREERVKEKKERRDKSPKARSPTPSSKRLPSPSPKYKEKEERKGEAIKVKKSDEKSKSEKKAKKERRDKEKERKESKHKDRLNQKSIEQKESKSSSREKEPIREKELSPMPQKPEKKDRFIKEKDVIKEPKESEHSEKNGKLKYEKFEDKPKHKHKKKDKDKKDKDKSNEREKSHKIDKKNFEKPFANNSSKYIEINKDIQRESEKSNLFNSPKNTSLIENKNNEKPKKPINSLVTSFSDSESCNSSISSHEDLITETIKVEPKKELFDSPPIKTEVLQVESQHNSEPQIRKMEESKPEATKIKSKREKSKKNKDKKGERDTEKRRKRKIEMNVEDEPQEKLSRDESSRSKDSDNDLPFIHDVDIDDDYDEYMDLLRDLQHKILALQDSAELQKVVELIAETGRFEVSAQTFDFDLCVLERSTITQLQNFFDGTS